MTAPSIGTVAAPPAGRSVMLPRTFRVHARRRDTRDTVTLLLEPVDGEPLQFVPGQFTMLSAFGVGEVPISISGDAEHPELLQHTIRDVGGVTHALVGAARGQLVGVRGPFGTGWEALDGAGGDMVILAGGIGLAPLRPAVLQVLANRARFGRVVLLYGTRTPEDVLFARALETWRGRFDFDVDVTVDYGPPEWRGNVGLVTGLIARAGFDATRTLALVCGPEVMMRATAEALLARGVGAERIRLAMERNMKCGVGLCGHCQLRELFTCIDGPVLSYDRVRWHMGQREL